jgi:hypothetical protein
VASGSEENSEDDDDVQGLSRVVDALSTIMWPTMVRERDSDSGKRKTNELRPSLFDFDDAVLLAEGEEEDEEETLAALMEADAAEQGAPQTRTTRMRREMEALERWLVENEELHKAEFGEAGVDDGDGDDEGEDEDEDHDGGDAPTLVQASGSAAAPDIHMPVDDPWVASSIAPKPTLTPTPPTALAPHSISIATPASGFDDDFSAFVSASPVVSIAGDSAAAETTTSISTAAATPALASASEPIPDARRLHTQTQLLLPSHTGGSFRSLRSAVSEMSISDTGDDLLGGGGYEALDDRSNSSLNFSPEHDDDDDDADMRMSIGGGQRSGDRAGGLGDVPFDLPDILSALQTIREDVAGIEDEAERRATTARFASEFVFRRMGVDGDETEG